MHYTLKSFRHALAGLIHALTNERNLLRFTVVYGIVLAFAARLAVAPWEWCVLVLAGGLFVVTELLNTALERLVDAVHELEHHQIKDGYHLGLKRTKDVASGAALMGLMTLIAVVLIVLLPHLIPLIAR